MFLFFFIDIHVLIGCLTSRSMIFQSMKKKVDLINLLTKHLYMDQYVVAIIYTFEIFEKVELSAISFLDMFPDPTTWTWFYMWVLLFCFFFFLLILKYLDILNMYNIYSVFFLYKKALAFCKCSQKCRFDGRDNNAFSRKVSSMHHNRL